MPNNVALDYAPYAYQTDFHGTDKRFNLVVGGRRVGKSKMALMELVKHCLETPKATAWWVAPTITMAREVGWEEFKDYKETLAPAIDTLHETLLRVKFKNGSTISFKGADNERSLRGRGLSYLVIDEAAFIEPEIWTRALRPALSDRQGRALLISTPNGRNWFYGQAAYASNAATWGYYHWPTYLNPLITEAELIEAANTVSEMDFRQEYLAEFITKEGMVYDNFHEDNIIEPGSPSLHDCDVFLGIDFGYANPTAICFMAVDRVKEEVYQFDEIYVARASLEQIEELMISVLLKHGLTPASVNEVFTDPAGNAAELSSGVSPVDYLRRSRFGWNVSNKGSEIAPGVSMVRSFIQAADGTRRYHITKNCMESIRSLTGYTYTKESRKYDTIKEEPLKDGIHDHMCDAIRYFFVNRFDQSRWVAKSPEMYAYGIDLRDKGRVIMKTCQIGKHKFPSKTGKNEPPYICRNCAGEL